MSESAAIATETPEANPLPLVSVIVPIYNGEADLPDLLACLQTQTYPATQVEYLLIDNGSRDRTAELLRTAAETAKDAGITLRPLSETQIQSSYAARNTGIRAATGEILAFTDADCRPRPDWLELLMRPFADPHGGLHVGLVAGEIVALPGTTLLEQHAELGETLSQKHTLAHSFLPYGQTANLAVRRAILKKVGLFRPYLTTGGDADLCWRIQQAGEWQIQFAEQAIVQHRHRATLPALQKQWQRYGQSNRYLHELHDVPLMRDISGRETVYRLGRWLLKELPIASLRAIAGKATLADLLNTPIGLLNVRARSAGQRTAHLPEQARDIAPLE